MSAAAAVAQLGAASTSALGTRCQPSLLPPTLERRAASTILAPQLRVPQPGRRLVGAGTRRRPASRQPRRLPLRHQGPGRLRARQGPQVWHLQRRGRAHLCRLPWWVLAPLQGRSCLWVLAADGRRLAGRQFPRLHLPPVPQAPATTRQWMRRPGPSGVRGGVPGAGAVGREVPAASAPAPFCMPANACHAASTRRQAWTT